MLFITHQLPKTLQVDAIVKLQKGISEEVSPFMQQQDES
jgi:hypothetical protein